MNGNHRISRTLIVSSLMVSMLVLSACRDKNDSATAQAADASAASQPAAANAAYVPPTADQLYQMVAPIALFPDKLLALVLAGSTYPDQITAANTWVTQNPNLSGTALTSAADQQAWDPSVKALTAFPAVLSQMATNIAWTTTLGQAYYNDPADVMNAIQVMRQRAQASGNLRSNRQITVAQAAPSAAYAPVPDEPDVYAGPAVVPPPSEMIAIEPAQPDVVYVPAYDPALVYGAPMAIYPGYAYQPPVIVPGVAFAGPVSFGVGIAVGTVFGTVGWGWHAWGMHWGGPHDHGGPGNWQRPAIVYNNTTYISRSTTVVNRYGNHINNSPRIPGTEGAGNRELPHAGAMTPQRAGAMTLPHFTADDARPGARPAPQFEAGHPAEMQSPRHEPMQRPMPVEPRPPMLNEHAVRPSMPPPVQQPALQQQPHQHEQIQREQAPAPRAPSYPQARPQAMERPHQPPPQAHPRPPQPHPAPEHHEGGHEEGRHQ